MRLARSSHQRLETFFREYLNDEAFQLPEIYFYVGRFARVLTNLINVHGITLGSRIFIKPILLSLNQNNLPKLPEDLVAHEIAHVLQYKREGFIKFFYKYLTSYFGNLRKKKNWSGYSRHQAYLEIPFEIEARAEKFTEWNKKE
jgi:DNA repair photolyase